MAQWRGIHRRHGDGGFTLVEILIVAALIALFSAIAVINVQEMYDQNLRRAAITECREISTALSMSVYDVSFFPKLNYLAQPQKLITTTAGALRADFDYIGYYRPGATTPPRNIADLWQNGGYYAMAQARRGIFARQSGIAYMRLPSGASGQDSQADSLVEWPTDPWGNPYVVYLLKVTPALTPEYRFIEDPTEAPDYMAAVVSYGQNGVPGAIVHDKTTLKNQTTELRQARLYLDGDLVATGAAYTLPLPAGYNYASGPVAKARLDILRNPSTPAFYPGAGPLDSVVGIMDPGSDDILVNF